jgi:hypothetical protein
MWVETFLNIAPLKTQKKPRLEERRGRNRTVAETPKAALDLPVSAVSDCVCGKNCAEPFRISAHALNSLWAPENTIPAGNPAPTVAPFGTFRHVVRQ